MFLESKEVGYSRLRSCVEKYSKAITDEGGIAVAINGPILQDAFYSARTSLGFYNIEPANINHYKEAAHIAYWIHKLKPLRCPPPLNIRIILTNVVRAVEDSFFGTQSRFEAEYVKAADAFRSHRCLPINEVVALYMVSDMIRVAQLEAADSFSARVKAPLVAKIDIVHERFNQNFRDLVLSLRYHNYSARAFSSLIEHILKIEDI
jgi:hypothetical protein